MISKLGVYYRPFTALLTPQSRMHLGTHFFAGWLVATTVEDLTSRERAFVAFAGVIPDVDGLGILAEWFTRDSSHPLTWYSDYHHVLGHNLAFGIAVSALVWTLSRRSQRWRVALLALVAFHLHLLGDIAGSGSLDGYRWSVPYLWPFSHALDVTWAGGWPLSSWQNTAITIALMLAIVTVSWRVGYSPAILVNRKADAVFIASLRARFGEPPARSRPAD